MAASGVRGTGGGAGARARRPRLRELARSIRGRLIMLTAALVLSAAAAASVLIVDAYTSHRASTERQIAETAGAMSLAVDGKAREVTVLLQALAASPYLRAGDMAAFERQAREIVPYTDKWVVVIDESGQQLVNTHAPPGAPLPRIDLPIPGVPPMQRRETYVSNLLPGLVEPGPILAFATQAAGPDGPYTVAVAMRPSVLNGIIAEQHLPVEWYGTLIDRNGVVMARNAEPERFVGKPAREVTRAFVRTAPEGVHEAVSLDGRRTLVAHRRSPVTGWTFLVGVPRSEISGALTRSLAMTFALSLGLLAIGAVLTVWFARGVARAVMGLADAAETLGRGEPVRAISTGIRETDAVADALQDASQKLRSREDELRLLNETLEARVAERSLELAETTERLVQARKVEALGRLTGGVAHDFNNLLTAVLGNLDLLGKRLTDDSLQKYVAHARQATERGAKLTAQLLAFARRQRLEPEPLDVNQTVQSLQVLLDRALGGATRVTLRLTDQPAWAMTDRTQLELVVLNLAINARDAMDGGGEVIIETARETVSDPAPQMEAPPAGEFVTVSVADSGSGMTPEVLALIWEPFFTTKAVGAGSGLGLPQVLGVVQQLGGGVRVDTEPGKGTKVTVYLPVAEPVDAAEAEAAPAPAPELAGLKVLLVDDDPDVRRATAELLADLGCELRESGDGADALARLEAMSELDLVVMDYAMPGLTGAETAARMAALRPALPVLLISGYMDIDVVGRSWSGPVLAKPFDRAQLAARLSAVLQERRSQSD